MMKRVGRKSCLYGESLPMLREDYLPTFSKFSSLSFQQTLYHNKSNIL